MYADTLPKLLEAAPSTAIELSTPEGLHRLLTFGELRERASSVAAQLRRCGVGQGDRVAILLPTSVDLLATMFGAWMLGAVTLILPPLGPALSQLERRTVLWAIGSAKPKLIVAGEESWPVLDARSIVARALDRRDLRRPVFGSGIGALQFCDPDQVTHLTLSSGRTGRLRLCSFTHAQVIGRAEAIADRIDITGADRVVSALPIDHAFGWLAGLIAPIAWKTPLRLIAPQLIAADPSLWLSAIAETQATVTPVCASTIAALVERPIERRIGRGVLGRWRYAWCSGGPLYESVLSAFEQRFASFGVSSTTLRPAFTVTEAGVAVTLLQPQQPRSVVAGFASHGVALAGAAVRIVDPVGTPLQDGEEGRIFLTSEGIGGLEIDRVAPRPPWLDTGDLGMIIDGELFITGRVKPLTERAGKKIHLDYVELAARLVPGVSENGVAALSRIDHQLGREEVVLAVEAAPNVGSLARHARAIASAVADATGVAIDRVEAVRSGSLCHVASGAPRRRAARALLGMEGNDAEAAA